ncbi:hypothetical protein [Haloarchaeobius amylolyticus]|uniref:hypothetical protein n=1 Tax=Haloarchaeobius amylolyticus TaxID=1198296 RepID=UPI00227050B8|nr:hypothetical protein [Haloarchaeobius amylolyticus]
MNSRKHVFTTVALALLVALAGCSAFVGTPTDDGDDDSPEGKEIKADAVNQMQSVHAYNYSMVTVVEFSDNELRTESSGTVNISAQRMAATNVVTAVRTNSTQTRSFSEAYIFGEQQCLFIDDEWSQSDVDRSPWRANATLGAQQEILNNSETTLRNGTLNGQDVYVIEVRPNQEAIQQLVGNDTGNVDFGEVTYRQYIDKDSKNLLQSTMNATYVVNGRAANLSVKMSFSDYNTTHEIELPRAAGGKNRPCAGMNGTAGSNRVVALA